MDEGKIVESDSQARRYACAMSTLDELNNLYPAVAALPSELRASTSRSDLQLLDVAAGTALFEEHHPCAGFPFVLAGEVRVARGSAQGRSIELYRVTPGEVCIVSASCLFGHRLLSAHGSASLPTRLAVLSPAGFEQWVAHEPFRRYVFGLFADRLADVIELAEAVAFQRLDQRLAAALLGHANPLQLTHQALADELGTVREIVTRLLRRFERAGWLALGRERITLHDPAALRALAAGDIVPR
jgi:CRP/FNR family transcriptional regulator